MARIQHIFLSAALAVATITPALAENTLNSGSSMKQGDKLSSDNGKYELVYQTDGNLVLYQTQGHTPLWASYTAGTISDRLFLTEGGNLCLYNGPTFAWGARGLFGPGAKYSLVMQDDGNAVIYNPTKRMVWASYTSEKQRTSPDSYPMDRLDPAATDRLKQGKTLGVGDILVSANKQYFLVFQSNGNLSLYRVNGDKKVLLWDAMTANLHGKVLTMADNGNLWLNAGDIRVWGTQGIGASAAGYELVVQNDGNLVVYDGKRKAIWASQTAGR